ncbi:unnamed protein product [Peniophora sp. CBMAI 1063]|nr:unnamed protein product [Peniophora sp. CBMAI 1063]
MDQINPLLFADDYCTLCELSFENRRDFTKHCKNVHSLQCLLCDRKYDSQRALDQHYRDSIVHPHCECGEGFPDKFSLQAHLQAGHKDEVSVDPSEPANNPGSTHAPLQPPGAAQHRCAPCNKTYGSEKALKQHYRDSVLHPNCQYCEEAFSGVDVLEHHVVTMHAAEPSSERLPHSVPEDSFKRGLRCELCNRKYVSEKALDQHYRDSPRHPTCEHCDASFPDLRAREAHVIEVHKAGRGKQNTPLASDIGVGARPVTYRDLHVVQETLALFLGNEQWKHQGPEMLLCSACRVACASVVMCVSQHILCEKCVPNAAPACPTCHSELSRLSISLR